MKLSTTVLIIDEDRRVLKLIVRLLTREGWAVDSAGDYATGIRYFDTHPRPDLVVLRLPSSFADSWDTFLSILELQVVPVLVIASAANEDWGIRALEAGATDYLLLPFKPAALVARVRVAMRTASHRNIPHQQDLCRIGPLTIDEEHHQVLLFDEPVKLSKTEYRLLNYLLRNRGRVLTHRQILENVWGWEYEQNVEYVHVYISHLRRKLEANPNQPDLLLTEHGIGYRFATN